MTVCIAELQVAEDPRNRQRSCFIPVTTVIASFGRGKRPQEKLSGVPDWHRTFIRSSRPMLRDNPAPSLPSWSFAPLPQSLAGWPARSSLAGGPGPSVHHAAIAGHEASLQNFALRVCSYVRLGTHPPSTVGQGRRAMLHEGSIR